MKSVIRNDIDVSVDQIKSGDVFIHNGNQYIAESDAYIKNNNWGVDVLKRDDANSFWRAAIKYDVENIMRQNNLQGYAIQAELLGPGIQANIYQLNGVEFYVFDVYSVKQARYLYPTERRELIATLGLNQVPIVCESTTLGTMEEIIALADGTSMLYNTLREGIVFKQLDGDMTFKSISQQYLIKTGN